MQPWPLSLSLSSSANSSSRSIIGVFDHTATFDAGCFGYVSDITTKEERTKRMGFALGDLTSSVVPPQSLVPTSLSHLSFAGSITIALTVSLYFGGFITSLFDDPRESYLVILFTALAIGIIGIVYALFMEQSLEVVEEKKTPFFQLSSITECFRVIFKVKENRAQKLVVTFVFFAMNITFITPDFEYMMGRLKYKDFDRSMFNYYSGTKNGQVRNLNCKLIENSI